MNNVINHENAKYSGATQEYKSTCIPKNNKDRVNASDLLSWDN